MATIWTVIGPAAYFGWYIAFMLSIFWVLVRNAPTLRSRRFRVHSIFWNIQYLVLCCFAFSIPFVTIASCLPREWMNALMPGPFMVCAFVSASLIILPLIWADMRTMSDDREERIREAIARFDPATMTADEPEVAAKPFPQRWIWIIALYAAAIVAAGCLGVLLR